jgi:hypothetical protein
MLISTLKVITYICRCKLLALANAIKATLLSGLVLLVGNRGGGTDRAGRSQGAESELAERYGWTLAGEWPAAEAEVVLKTAEGIERYVARVAQVDGRQWMQSNVGAVTFHRDTWLNEVLNANVSLPGGHILVLEGYGGSVEPYTDMAHEVAHVIDNNQGGTLPATVVGGGAADAMVSEVGGNPELCRPRILCPEDYGLRVGGTDRWPEGMYATTGVAEDFAETFAYAAFFPERVPTGRLAWMDGYVADMAAEMAAEVAAGSGAETASQTRTETGAHIEPD